MSYFIRNTSTFFSKFAWPSGNIIEDLGPQFWACPSTVPSVRLMWTSFNFFNLNENFIRKSLTMCFPVSQEKESRDFAQSCPLPEWWSFRYSHDSQEPTSVWFVQSVVYLWWRRRGEALRSEEVSRRTFRYYKWTDVRESARTLGTLPYDTGIEQKQCAA